MTREENGKDMSGHQTSRGSSSEEDDDDHDYGPFEERDVLSLFVPRDEEEEGGRKEPFMDHLSFYSSFPRHSLHLCLPKGIHFFFL